MNLIDFFAGVMADYRTAQGKWRMNEEKQAEQDLKEIEQNPTWKPQAKMSQVLAKLPVLKPDKEEKAG